MPVLEAHYCCQYLRGYRGRIDDESPFIRTMTALKFVGSWHHHPDDPPIIECFLLPDRKKAAGESRH